MAGDTETVVDAEFSLAERLPADLMLLKMENEQMFSVARMQPRDPMKIVGQLKQLIDAYPAAADEAVYSKPVGTIIEVTCKCGVRYEVTKVEPDTLCPACDAKFHNDMRTRKVKKFAEGLSIRAAESIRSIYGYTRLATTTEMLENGSAKITGILVDFAAGNMTSDERIVSPYYKARGGSMARTPEDRFLGVVVKAEKSKLRRDLILDNTPNIVKAMFRDACEQKMAALVSPEMIEQKILPAFAGYGITGEHLALLIGRPYSMGWNEEDRLQLRKILSALKNEETTARELLDGLVEEKPHTPADTAGNAGNGTQTVSAADFVKPKGKAEPTPEKPAKTEAAAKTETAAPAAPQTTPEPEKPQEAGEPAEPANATPAAPALVALSQEEMLSKKVVIEKTTTIGDLKSIADAAGAQYVPEIATTIKKWCERQIEMLRLKRAGKQTNLPME